MNISAPLILAVVLNMGAIPLSQAQSGSVPDTHPGSKASIDKAPVYSCDLRAQFNQCRQFAIDPAQASIRLAQVEESCQSLGGRFAAVACPSDALIARCAEVKFRRDLHYDNAYYAGEPSRWSLDSLAYACAHLPGQYRAPEPIKESSLTTNH